MPPSQKVSARPFLAQIHHCPFSTGTPGSVWSSCSLVALLGAVVLPGEHWWVSHASPQPIHTRGSQDAPILLPHWFKHTQVLFFSSPHPLQRLFLPHLKHLRLQGASSQQSALFVSWVMQVSTFPNLVGRLSRASRQELLIATIDHLSSFDLLAADYSCCSWWWNTRGPACTSISLSNFLIFLLEQNTFPQKISKQMGFSSQHCS